MTHGLKWENEWVVLYPYSCVFSHATVKQRNDTVENDMWSEMGKHYAQGKEDSYSKPFDLWYLRLHITLENIVSSSDNGDLRLATNFHDTSNTFPTNFHTMEVSKKLEVS